MKYIISILFIAIVLLVFQCKKDLELEPAVKTGRLENVSAKSAIVHAEIIDIGNGISDYGHCYKELSTPTVSDMKTSFGSAKQLKEFRSELEGLEAGTEYKVRAYVSTDDKTYYGSELTLVTNDGIAVLETGEVTIIRARSAHCEGFIISSGGDDIMEKGFCWSKSTPVKLRLSSGHVSVNYDSESFQGELDGLDPETNYFVNTYAVTSVDTAYGMPVEFTTQDGIIKFDGIQIGETTSSEVEVSFNVSDNGGDTIESVGLCFGEGSSPGIEDSHVVIGNDVSSYTHVLTDLKSNTQYYIRPFGINSVKVYYGSQIIVQTSPVVVVGTKPATNIRMSSALAGGQISGAETATITERGVCWSTASGPTVDDNYNVSDDIGNDYEVMLTGLMSSTSYTYKAYLRLGESVVYGDIQSLTTDNGVCEVNTTKPGSITMASAVSGGMVLDDGGDAVTARGVCWGTSSYPTVSNSHTSDGSGTGSYISSLSGLTANTSYFVRAYATNSQGTFYGDNQVFTTLQTLSAPTVSTSPISSISQNSAQSGGHVVSDGNATVTARGVCWSTSSYPTVSNSHTSDGSGTGSYSSSLSGLTANTTYYVRAYATNSQGTSYGTQQEFTTLQTLLAPTVSTSSISSISQNSAQSGGHVSSDGNATVTARGICWSTSSYPTVSNSHTSDGSGTGSYSSSLSGLTANTTYYVRAYATNSQGTSYGAQQEFTTLQTLSEPTVSTSPISSISQYSAQSGGHVVSDGNATVTARGVCWSTSSYPTVSNSHTSDGSGTGSYSSSLSGLTSNTTYYVRAYATNSQGTSYGAQQEFTTLQTLSAPTVSTSSISSISQYSAQSGGHVSSDGNATVTARGVCWSTSSYPTVSNSHTSDGSGTGSYSSSLSGLTSNTTYYVRAYATNSQGTSYGAQQVFTTLQTLSAPTVSTSSMSNISEYSAQSGGYVSSDGNATVTARGVCWSTSSYPTVFNSHTSDGSGTGSYSSSLSGLTSNTTYYVRAYATNSQGTSYGAQQVFTTMQTFWAPTVSTSTINNISQNSAQSGGYVSSDGNATVTARGVCWSSSTSSPTIYDQYTFDGSGTGSYSSYLSGLIPSTTYYVRAYATNSQGTSYGDLFSFTTADISYGSVSDYDGNVYRTVVIGNQTWMADNLATTHYSDGTALVDGRGAGNIQYSSDTKFWFVYNDDLTYKYTYGLLYSWAAARNGTPSSSSNPSNVQGVCPSGWHLPSKSEWEELFSYLGGSSVAGGKMKERGLWHWRTPNTAATNSSGFTALPCGNRLANGFYTLDTDVNYWSSDFWATMLRYSKAEAYTVSYYGAYYGLNVRCVKD